MASSQSNENEKKEMEKRVLDKLEKFKQEMQRRNEETKIRIEKEMREFRRLQLENYKPFWFDWFEGFKCRAGGGGLYCAIHRCSDKNDCHFDYRLLGATAILQNNL